jgi:hypothetical protein
MIWTLIKKELKDLAPFALGMALCLIVVVGGLTGNKQIRQLPVLNALGFVPSQTNGIPFLEGDKFNTFFSIITGAFLALFAARQALWETLRGTKLFLYHRPVSKRTLLLSKVGTGIGLYWLIGLGAILLYGGWASDYWGMGRIDLPFVFGTTAHSAGNLPAPFEWSMADSAFRILVCAPLLYLGLFTAMLSPTFWRKKYLLFPILAGGGLLGVLQHFPRFWILSLPLVLLALALMIKTSLDVELATDAN